MPSQRKGPWLRLRSVETLTLEERSYSTALLDAELVIRKVQQLIVDFGTMVRTRDSPALIAWLERADASDLPEVRLSTAAIRQDRAAVETAPSLVLSNGQTEGRPRADRH